MQGGRIALMALECPQGLRLMLVVSRHDTVHDSRRASRGTRGLNNDCHGGRRVGRHLAGRGQLGKKRWDASGRGMVGRRVSKVSKRQGQDRLELWGRVGDLRVPRVTKLKGTKFWHCRASSYPLCRERPWHGQLVPMEGHRRPHPARVVPTGHRVAVAMRGIGTVLGWRENQASTPR